MTKPQLPQVRTCKIILSKNAMSLAKHTAKLTVKTAMQGEQLSKLSRENEDQTIEVLCEVVRSLNDSINVGEKMNLEQIYECALSIMTEYWMLKIDEILNCFKMAKSGKFGKIYGLDQPTVMGFILKYDTEVKAGYYEANETTHTNRQREAKSEPKHIAISVEDMKKLETKK